MDESRFDALTKALSAVDSRRRLLAFFVTAPILGDRMTSGDVVQAKPRKHHPDRRHDARQDLAADKKKRKKHKKTECQSESVALTCAGKCGSVANNCNQVVDCGSCACGPACDVCFTCQEHGPNARGACVVDPAQQGASCGSNGQVCQPDGACACVSACSGKACGPDGCDGRCGPCDGGQVCTTAGQCCTPTTCAAIEQEMCQNPDDCGDYGICGTFPDGCGGILECGGCGHSCFACQDTICVRRPGSEVCGPDTCCTNQCCFNANQGVCGANIRCTGENCCPLGFTCCNGTVNGSPRSTCYNIQTYCQGRGLFCRGAGNTCCPDEPCCTSDAQCTGGRRCLSDSRNPSTAGCCKF